MKQVYDASEATETKVINKENAPVADENMKEDGASAVNEAK